MKAGERLGQRPREREIALRDDGGGGKVWQESFLASGNRSAADPTFG
jgi:hypothetical protein